MAKYDAEKINDKRVSFEDLFSTEFMQLHTDTDNIEKFLSSANVSTETKEDVDALSNPALDSYVSAHSKFSLWQEMLRAAISIYRDSALGL